MIQVFQTNFPPSNQPIADTSSGNMTNAAMAFFRALYQRTGGGTGLVNQSNATASGGLSTSPPVLTADWNVVTNTTIGPNVELPALQPGQQIMVYSNNGSGLTIYAPSGYAIDAGLPSYSLADTKMQIFWYVSTSLILSTQLG